MRLAPPRERGATIAEAFEQVALALTAIVTDPHLVRDRERVDIARAGSDPELLLVDWLNAVVYEMAVRRMLFGPPPVVARLTPVICIKG